MIGKLAGVVRGGTRFRRYWAMGANRPLASSSTRFSERLSG